MNYPNNNQWEDINSWDDKESEYFGDFSWDDKREYFDNFKWDVSNSQDTEEPIEDQYEGNFNNELEELDKTVDEIENIDFIEEVTDPTNFTIENNENHEIEKIIVDKMIRKTYTSRIYNILKQLKLLTAEDVEFGTEQQGTILQSRIINIDDNIVTVRTAFKEITIPIHQIVGIYSRKLPAVALLIESENEVDGKYDYYDRPLMEYFLNHIGEEYIINTMARDEVFNRIQGSITKVEEGIIILSNTVAVSIGKIISVEKDIRALYGNINKN